MLHHIIQRTLRVPVQTGAPGGDGASATRQLDIALMNLGFKLSRDLFDHLSQQHPSEVLALGQATLAAVKELIGDHIQHNVYFIDFPANVPDTTEFWMREIVRLLLTGQTNYGRYQHSYADMLAHHDAFIASGKEKVTVLQLGKTLPEEIHELYLSLAQSPIPLNTGDLELLQELAIACLAADQPESIPVRETRAIINLVRIREDRPILVTTVTDVLRLACALSEGDISLQEATKFRSFPRSIRRTLLGALDDLLVRNPGQFADIDQYRERWKRLAERLHPHEYVQGRYAQDAFAVARREKRVFSLEAQIEVALGDGEVAAAIALFRARPGLLVRNVDRLLRVASAQDRVQLQEALSAVVEKVSGRVLLSLREHLQNTAMRTMRVFTNRKGRAWVASDDRGILDEAAVGPFIEILDQELARRMPRVENLVIDPAILGVAVPLSDKNKGSGFAIMPRGSTMSIGEELLRFFVYWKQKVRRTDYDLSAVILDKHFSCVEQLSWTNLKSVGGVHSGDLTEAQYGATEFIELDLSKVTGSYIIPQVNIYAGEGFDEVESCFFGFMERTPESGGKPFEAATVRMKSDLRGAGRVALPMAFVRDEAGAWSAKWMHLYLKGYPNFNRTETNRLTTSVLARAIVEQRFLNMEYLIGLMKKHAEAFSWYTGAEAISSPATFIGLQMPDGMSADRVTVYTLGNLHGLVPS